MWWKLGGVGIATAAILAIFLWPTRTITLTLDLPPGAPPPSPGQVEASSGVFGMGVTALSVTVILGVAAWIAWRIVRHHWARGNQA